MQKSSICNYLDEKGIARSHDGYNYLIHIIEYGIQHPDIDMEDYYEEAAKEYNVPKTRIQNCISYSIKKARETSKSFSRELKPKAFVRTAIGSLSRYKE